MKRLAIIFSLASLFAIGIGLACFIGVVGLDGVDAWPDRHPRTRRVVREDTPSKSVSAPATQAEVAQPATQEFRLLVDGVQREFIVYRPATLPATQAVPVVFMFHGGGGTGEQFYKMSGWKEKADQEGFIAVFPTALKYHTYSEEKVDNGKVQQDVAEYETRWSNFQLAQTFDPQFPDQKPADDVAFVRAIVTHLDQNYVIDQNRMYACGFSSGGNFSNRLMLEASDLFAAYCVSSAGSPTDIAEAAPAPGFIPRPAISILGSMDPKFRFSSQVQSFPIDETVMTPGSATRARFVDGYLDVLGLSDTYTYENTGKIGHFTFNSSLTPATAGLEYQLLIVQGMEHIFPNGKNNSLTAADVYWEFFEEYSL
jgi:polyhydroxybutyrate depolymerase